MTAVAKYRAASADLRYSYRWAEMLDKPYSGGGGGVGRIVNARFAKGEHGVQLYYQESDGSRNYHTAPETLLAYLSEVIREEFPQLLTQALKRQESELQRLAGLARDEHAQLMRAAGLDAGVTEVPRG